MKIAFLGDIALFGCFSANMNSSISDKLKEIGNYLSSFDYVIGNLESPFSIRQKRWGAKSAYLCSDVENAEVLKWLHIHVVNLANNHMFDYGREGYETTKKLLDKVGIKYFGSEGKTVDVNMDDNHLRFSGYCCYSTNPLGLAAKQGDYGINKYNVTDVKESMKKAHDDGFFNIVAVHAGLEHVNYPSLDHVCAARQLADVCPFFYYGHHPHVIQGVEEYNGSLIAHSLGNFCFDDVYKNDDDTEPLVRLTENNRTGMILELTIENNKIVSWKEQLIHISKDGAIDLIDDKLGLVNKYNDALANCEKDPEYTQYRQKIINDRTRERKTSRNIKWVIERLRPRYVRLVFDMHRNSKLYADNVTRYLNDK